MKLDDAVATIKRHEPELRKLGIESLSLFGSTARDEATEQSDIDVEVKLSEGPRGLTHLARLDHLKEVLQEILGRPVDVITDTAGSPSVRQAIAQDRVHAF